jgi:hypothetical protein
MFRHRHHLVFCWLLVCQAIDQEKATVKGLARLAPRNSPEWHLRVSYLVVDSTLKSQNRPQASVGQEVQPERIYPLYLRPTVAVKLQWVKYRIPLDVELVRRKDDLKYRSENTQFRWRLVRFRRSSWAEMVVAPVKFRIHLASALKAVV